MSISVNANLFIIAPNNDELDYSLLFSKLRVLNEATCLEVFRAKLRFALYGDNLMSPSYCRSPMKTSNSSSLNKNGNPSLLTQWLKPCSACKCYAISNLPKMQKLTSNA